MPWGQHYAQRPLWQYTGIMFTSVRSLHRLGRQGNLRDDSAEISFHTQLARVSRVFFAA